MPVVTVPFTARDEEGTVRLSGTIDLDLPATNALPFSLDGLFTVGDIGQVTIAPASSIAVPLDVYSAGTHVFAIQTDGSLHGKAGQSLAFDL